jgi:ParB-like chromosome segregation protein Spo0J
MKMPEILESIQIDALIPYARNSRTHSDGQVAQIASSIKEFGFTNPVLIDGGGGGSLPDMAECLLHASWA